jgi:hypothetical protein
LSTKNTLHQCTISSLPFLLDKYYPKPTISSRNSSLSSGNNAIPVAIAIAAANQTTTEYVKTYETIYEMIFDLLELKKNKPRLLMTGVPPDAVIERAQQLFDLSIWREDVAIGDALLKNVAGMDALIVMPGDKLSAETIDALPDSIKVLGTYSVGTDHVDLPAASKRGLKVFHSPDVLTQAVAELTLFLIIAAARDTSGVEKILRDNNLKLINYLL